MNYFMLLTGVYTGKLVNTNLENYKKITTKASGMPVNVEHLILRRALNRTGKGCRNLVLPMM